MHDRGKRRNDVFLHRIVDCVVHEPAIELSAHVFGYPADTVGIRLSKNHREKIIELLRAVGSCLSRYGRVSICRRKLFVRCIMARCCERVVDRCVLRIAVSGIRESREDPGRRLHVLFGIVRIVALGDFRTFADRKQFLKFPRVVFVRTADDICVAVQIPEHCRVNRHELYELLEIAQGVLPEKVILSVHEPRILHIDIFRRKMIVPEEHHFLANGHPLLRHHPYPPRLQIGSEIIIVRGIEDRIHPRLSGG